MTRLNTILATLLGVQLLLIVVIYVMPSSSGSTFEDAIYPGFDGANAATISITEKVGKERRAITVEKTGSDWVVSSMGSYPAKAGVADKVLTAIKKAQAVRRVSSSTQSHKAFEIGDENHRLSIKVEAADGTVLANFYIGKYAMGTSYFRKVGENAVVELADAMGYEISGAAHTWIDTKFLTFTVADVEGMTLQHSGKRIVAKMGADGGWKIQEPAGLETTKAKVEQVVRPLSSVYMDKPVEKEDKAKSEYGFASPTVEASVLLKGGKIVRLIIGKKKEGEDNLYFAKKVIEHPPAPKDADPNNPRTAPTTPGPESGEGYVVLLRGYTVDSLKKDPDHFKPDKPEEKAKPPVIPKVPPKGLPVMPPGKPGPGK